jgi:hypothetical protein
MTDFYGYVRLLNALVHGTSALARQYFFKRRPLTVIPAFIAGNHGGKSDVLKVSSKGWSEYP